MAVWAGCEAILAARRYSQGGCWLKHYDEVDSVPIWDGFETIDAARCYLCCLYDFGWSPAEVASDSA